MAFVVRVWRGALSGSRWVPIEAQNKTGHEAPNCRPFSSVSAAGLFFLYPTQHNTATRTPTEVPPTRSRSVGVPGAPTTPRASPLFQSRARNSFLPRHLYEQCGIIDGVVRVLLLGGSRRPARSPNRFAHGDRPQPTPAPPSPPCFAQNAVARFRPARSRLRPAPPTPDRAHGRVSVELHGKQFRVAPERAPASEHPVLDAGGFWTLHHSLCPGAGWPLRRPYSSRFAFGTPPELGRGPSARPRFPDSGGCLSPPARR
jgi:hypothetical protein